MGRIRSWDALRSVEPVSLRGTVGRIRRSEPSQTSSPVTIGFASYFEYAQADVELSRR